MPRQRFRRNNRQLQHQRLKQRLRKKLAAKQGSKKICLTMIVKNESPHMHRLFESLYDSKSKSYVMDMISIVDTGSTDDTAEVILKWGEDHNIPAAVHHEPFKNFGYNRTHSVQMAKKTYPDADYLLLSDADFVWEIGKNRPLDKVLLTDHKYLIEQHNKALSYWNIRLLSAKVDWECRGVTHEYWTECDKQENHCGEIRASKICSLQILDLEDGLSKGNKYPRDERLLREGLADPGARKDLKTRYKFYLAQTLKDMGRHQESIEWYTKRAQDGGWAEEVYYAKFQIGFNYEQLGWKTKHVIRLIGKEEKTQDDLEFLEKWNPDERSPSELAQKSTQYFTDASVNYLAAHKYRKTRAESLYYLTRMYRSLGMNEQAYDLAIQGNTISYPEQDTLFIECGCYDYLFDFELSIAGFYLSQYKEVGCAALKRVLQNDQVPERIRVQAERNAHYYL